MEDAFHRISCHVMRWTSLIDVSDLSSRGHSTNAALKVIAGMCPFCCPQCLQNHLQFKMSLPTSNIWTTALYQHLRQMSGMNRMLDAFTSHIFHPVCYFNISKCIFSNIMWFLQSILNHMVWLVSKGTTKFQRKSFPLFCGFTLNTQI